MFGKTISDGKGPKTQSVEAVQALLKFYNHNQDVAELPPFYRLGAEMVLVRSNKGDVYYVTTPKTCSCPGAAYQPDQPCEHQRKYFPPQMREAFEDPTEGARRLAQPPNDSIMPEGKWAGGHNGPVDDLKVVA